ncbi:MAG: diadenylate cyclase CdaA [Oscillospiraceae bacterium]|nr:diadenylate cyclase CdaA [Oscillospiraceae bacterium]
MFTDLRVYLQDIIDYTVSVIKTMAFVDYIEIFILTCLMYILIRFVRETRAAQLLKGIFIIFVVSLLLQGLDFRVLGAFGEAIINAGVVAAIVMFQPELRRILEKMGRTQIVKSLAINLDAEPYKLSSSIEQISTACVSLSRKATGALIVIERETKLGEQISTGTILNAIPSEALFQTLFCTHTPLHDGAVIVRDGLVLAAGCFLPKPQKEELISKDLGSRHRAAIGMSEVSDAIVIIVSEETGTISIAHDGVLTRGYDYAKLHKYIVAVVMPAQKKKPKYKKPEDTVESAQTKAAKSAANSRKNKAKKARNKKGGDNL